MMKGPAPHPTGSSATAPWGIPRLRKEKRLKIWTYKEGAIPENRRQGRLGWRRVGGCVEMGTERAVSDVVLTPSPAVFTRGLQQSRGRDAFSRGRQPAPPLWPCQCWRKGWQEWRRHVGGAFREPSQESKTGQCRTQCGRLSDASYCLYFFSYFMPPCSSLCSLGSHFQITYPQAGYLGWETGRDTTLFKIITPPWSL